MRKILGIFLLLFAFTTVASADSYTDANGTIIYPDGSTITSVDYIAPTASDGYYGATTVNFSFSAGDGGATTLQPEGAGVSGSLIFTEDVSNVTLVWEESYGLYMNFFSYDYGELGSFTEPVCTSPTPCFGSITFADPGSFEMTFTTQGNGYATAGYGGVSAIAYTVAPEPSIEILLLLGVAGIAALGLTSCCRPLLAKVFQKGC